MQKIGSLRSNNPYNPFLGIATTVTRRARLAEGQLHPEEALSREQAIRFYTINSAKILFWTMSPGQSKRQVRRLIVLDGTCLIALRTRSSDGRCFRPILTESWSTGQQREHRVVWFTLSCLAGVTYAIYSAMKTAR